MNYISLILRWWRELLILILGVLCALLWQRGPEIQEKLVTETKIEYVDKVIEKEVIKYVDRVKYKDRVITKTITKPDGTRVETKAEEKSSTKVSEKTADSTKEAEKKETENGRTELNRVVTRRDLYGIGGSVRISNDFKHIEPLVHGRVRLGSSPISAVGSYGVKSKSFSLGVEVSF